VIRAFHEAGSPVFAVLGPLFTTGFGIRKVTIREPRSRGFSPLGFSRQFDDMSNDLIFAAKRRNNRPAVMEERQMAESSDYSDKFRHVFDDQLRQFDAEISHLRQFYECLTPDERSRFRAWLKKVAALTSEGAEWGAHLKVRIENDECDEEGNVLRWADAEFLPSTMLSAIAAWDAGEDFAPPGRLP
jgi:hypothetical protein